MDWDEAIYAQVSREILTSHQWLTLHWQQQPFFQKPPLSFWITATLFRIFGVSEFWARVPSALAGVGVVLLTLLIARRLANNRTALIAAAALLTTRQFDDVARQGTTDTLLCLCIYLAVYFYLRITPQRVLFFYAMCAAIGLGAMIKGPAVLLAPLAIAIHWLIKRDGKIVIAPRHIFAGALLFLVIVAPWHLWMLAQHGRAFLSSYAGYQLAARATHVLEGSGGGPFFYLQVVLRGAFPWSILALLAAVRWLWRRQWAYNLPWILILGTLLLYSCIPTKHAWYILPVYPALAIEAARLLADAGQRWRVVQYATVAVVTIGLALASTKFLQRSGDPLANQVAQLARQAQSPRGSSPLLILTLPGSATNLDTPTAAFYSNRPTVLLAVPADADKLAALLQTRSPLDAILPTDALPLLASSVHVQPTARTRQLCYAQLSLQ